MFVTHHIALLQCSFFLCGLTSSISACCNGLVVTVDGSSSDVVRDCSKVSGSLANLTCSSLQDVLLSVSENITLSGGGSEDLISCVEVRLLPGHCVLTQTITVVGQNLKLLGEVLVSKCTFRNNTSDPNSVAVQSTSDLFQRFAFTGCGGGCAFTISPSTSLTAVVENSTVEGNFAHSFGGGLYVGFDGNLNHTVTVNGVRLVKNKCPGAAGGLEIGFVQVVLIENRASFVAGTYFFPPGLHYYDSVMFP